ncbi:MAG: hypothetical protein ACREMP_09400 [Candidatus Tyrphobacter sp.]
MIAAFAATYVGLQALALSGVHQDVAGSQRGFAAGAFIEVQAGGRRVRVHLEGVPVVSVPQRASAHYGQATPAIGIVDGALRFGLDPRGDYFMGIGADVINQHTPLPNLDEVVASRLAGIRYEFGLHVPLGGKRFVEGLVGAVPALYGRDIYTSTLPVRAQVEPELASEVDYSVAYGFERGRSQWLVGLRAINFAAHFTQTGAAADRNAGFGLTLEWRSVLSR